MTPISDWQALLFVPVGADRHLASAIRHRPDAIILDLEDAVAPSEKAAARAQLADFQAQIIAEDPALAGLMLGSEDFSASLGIDPNGGGLVHLAAQIAVTASAHGLLYTGFPGSIGNVRSLELYARQIAEGRALGMQAVAAIHPAQLTHIRAAFRPMDWEIAWVKRVLESDVASGEGDVIALDGTL